MKNCIMFFLLFSICILQSSYLKGNALNSDCTVQISQSSKSEVGCTLEVTLEGEKCAPIVNVLWITPEGEIANSKDSKNTTINVTSPGPYTAIITLSDERVVKKSITITEDCSPKFPEECNCSLEVNLVRDELGCRLVVDTDKKCDVVSIVWIGPNGKIEVEPNGPGLITTEPGEYCVTVTYSDGCVDIACITVNEDCTEDCEPTGDCSSLTFNQTLTSNGGNGGMPDWSSGPQISGVSSTVEVTLFAGERPDRLTVLVNGGIVLNFTAGTMTCPENPVSQASRTERFCVEPCDVVEYIVTGGGICTTNTNNTGWTFTSGCIDGDCDVVNCCPIEIIPLDCALDVEIGECEVASVVWSGTAIGDTEVPITNTSINACSAGTYTVTVISANGCVASESITLTEADVQECCCPTDDCSSLTFNETLTSNGGNGGMPDWSSGPQISEVSSTVQVTLFAGERPDRLTVLVNGDIVLNFTAGTMTCPENPVSQASRTESFCVEPCDVVEYIVTGGGICTTNTNNTGWTFTSGCIDGDCDVVNCCPIEIIPLDCALDVEIGECEVTSVVWSGTAIGDTEVPITNTSINACSAGTYTVTVISANGCVASESITLTEADVEECCCPTDDCSNLTFTQQVTSDDNITVWSSDEIVSQVSSTISVSLTAGNIPDSLTVLVNGNVVLAFSAGANTCDDNPIVTGSIESGLFCVEPCDVVEYIVTGQICSTQGTTGWTLNSSCTDEECINCCPVEIVYEDCALDVELGECDVLSVVWSGTTIGDTEVPITNTSINACSAGTYIVTVTYTDGCVVSESITLTDADVEECCCPTNDCSNLTFTQQVTSAQNITNWSSGPIISQVSSTISVSLTAGNIPDSLTVLVNGNVVLAFSAGANTCDDNPIVTGSIESGLFCVEPCDVVEYIVTGQICSTQGTTGWTLNSSCTDEECINCCPVEIVYEDCALDVELGECDVLSVVWSGTAIGDTEVPITNTSINACSAGTYTVTVTYTDGCVVSESITLTDADVEECCCPTNDCSNLTFTQQVTSAQNITNWSSGPIISQVSSRIVVRLFAGDIPDSLTVLVNGNVVLAFSAGTDICDDNPVVTGSEGTGWFCVEPCDIVEYRVTGGICNSQGQGTTGWTLRSRCFGVCNQPMPSQNSDWLPLNNSLESDFESDFEYRNIETLRKVTVFPNPAADLLTIANVDPNADHQARVLTSTGKVVYLKNILGKDQITIDVSTFTKGLYIIELIDNFGHRTVEKFIKL